MNTSPSDTEDNEDKRWMARAIELAERGRGYVEPNPMVGCTIVESGRLLGEGWHRRFGGPHAEIEALRSCGGSPAGATLYVTLEPCCHRGKTPPCTEAILQAGIRRVVIASRDPFPEVAGRGIGQLEQAGIQVDVGLMEPESKALNAPYLYRLATGFPWLIAKWAISLDGRIATRTGDSRWISNEESREIVHQIRGRVDGIMVGIETVLADDPQLTARPEGPRRATRIVLDSRARIPVESRLVQSAEAAPVIVAVGPDADPGAVSVLKRLGCRVWQGEAADANIRLDALLRDLAAEGMTNLLVEGGGQVLGSCFDQNRVCEIHAFIAPRIIGGAMAPGPVGGQGIEKIQKSLRLETVSIVPCGDDVHISGRIPTGFD